MSRYFTVLSRNAIILMKKLFTIKSFNLLRVCKDLLLKLSIAHHYRLQSAKITQLGLSTITPILRKTTLDREELSNCRPISNLSVISKIIYMNKAVVKSNLTEHLSTDKYPSVCIL